MHGKLRRKFNKFCKFNFANYKITLIRRRFIYTRHAIADKICDKAQDAFLTRNVHAYVHYCGDGSSVYVSKRLVYLSCMRTANAIR